MTLIARSWRRNRPATAKLTRLKYSLLALDLVLVLSGLLLYRMNEQTRAAQHWALSFNGTSDSIEVDSAGKLNIGTSLTVDFWIRAENPTTPGFVVSQHQEGKSGYEIHINPGGSIRFLIHHGRAPTGYSALDSASIVADGTWHHVAATFNRGAMRITVDGTLGATQARAPVESIPTSVGPLLVARRDTEKLYFSGMLSDLRIWNTALAERDIQQARSLDSNPKSNHIIVNLILGENNHVTVTDHGPLNLAAEIEGSPVSVARQSLSPLSALGSFLKLRTPHILAVFTVLYAIVAVLMAIEVWLAGTVTMVLILSTATSLALDSRVVAASVAEQAYYSLFILALVLYRARTRKHQTDRAFGLRSLKKTPNPKKR